MGLLLIDWQGDKPQTSKSSPTFRTPQQLLGAGRKKKKKLVSLNEDKTPMCLMRIHTIIWDKKLRDIRAQASGQTQLITNRCYEEIPSVGCGAVPAAAGRWPTTGHACAPLMEPQGPLCSPPSHRNKGTQAHLDKLSCIIFGLMQAFLHYMVPIYLRVSSRKTQQKVLSRVTPSNSASAAWQNQLGGVLFFFILFFIFSLWFMCS